MGDAANGDCGMSHRYRHGMNWIRQEKRLSIYMRDHFACLYCGMGIETDEGMRLALDHVKHWGGNHESNLVTCCMDCNRQKSCWSLKTFLKRFTPHEVRSITARIERAWSTPIAGLLPEAKAIIKARKNPF
jgi:5-methylcytosine-specific restriction endonuclease McrA